MSENCDFPGCKHVYELRKIHETDCNYDGMYKGCGCYVIEDYLYHQHCNMCNKTSYHKHD